MPDDGIRKALPGDLQPLAMLRHAFWRGQEQMGLLDRRDLGLDALVAETEKLLGRPRSLMLVACNLDTGQPFGYVYATVQVAPHLDPAYVKVIEEIYVEPGEGRQGLGRQLAERGFSDVVNIPGAREQIRVIAGNSGARAFWQRLDFAEEVIIMERRKDG